MSFFTTHDSEAFFKSGLAKSAFKPTIYDNLPLDVYIPSIDFVYRMLHHYKIHPKFYMVHDSYLMFLKPAEKVIMSLKKSNKAAPLWHNIVSTTVRSSQYLRLNDITKNSDELASLAAIAFLKKLLSKANIEKMQEELKKQSGQQGQCSSCKLPPHVIVDPGDAVGDAEEVVRDYLDLSTEADDATRTLVGSGGSGFVKEALSVLRFLENRDEFRRRVKLLSTAVRFFRHFMNVTPTSLSHLQQVSLVGGINGITKMLHEKQLSDILPSELVLSQLGDVGKTLLALKIVQKQINVYQRAAAVKPVIFVDKSGSMAGEMDGVPKISMATGLALALHAKFNADVYLFDTEVEKVNKTKIVETLLKISADGGTDIDVVLEEIMRIGKPDYVYIIISDGITQASNDVLEKFKQSGLAKNTKLILVDYTTAEHYNWIPLLKQYGNVFYANSIAEFESATKRVLS